MNAGEIDTFKARVGLFAHKGVSYEDADRLAARLVQRDRDGDDRRLCIECASARPNTCSKGEAYLPAVLQRCPIFMAARGV